MWILPESDKHSSHSRALTRFAGTVECTAFSEAPWCLGLLYVFSSRIVIIFQ
jgi:hypothetical protein